MSTQLSVGMLQVSFQSNRLNGSGTQLAGESQRDEKKINNIENDMLKMT